MRWILLALLLVPSAYAADFYADVVIEVTNDGLVTITGETNHPELQIENSPDLTSKDGRYWLLNISLEDTFSDFVYELRLPPNAEVNYLKTPRLSRITDQGDSIAIIGTGMDQRFVIITQYQFVTPSKQTGFMGAIIIVLFILACAALLLAAKNRKKRINTDALTKRQRKIVELLEKSKKPLTQAQLEKETGYPKSSLSRNIAALERKGIISKEEKGMSNLITLKRE